MSKPKLWTNDFIIIFSTNFFTHIVFYLLMSTIALYVTTQYQTSQGMAGLTVGIFVLAALITRFFAGTYIERIGHKKVLIGSLCAFVLVMFLHLVADHLALLLIFRFIQGAAFGFITTSAGSIAAELIPDERRGEGTGYYATAMNVAMAIGPSLGIFLSVHSDFKTIILVGGIIALIDLIATSFLQIPKAEMTQEQVKVTSGFKIRHFVEPKSIPISIAMFTVALGYSSLLSFLSTYAKEIHLENIASIFFVVYAITLLSTRPFTGKWFDRFGENIVTYPLLICLALGFLCLSFAQNTILFLLAGALIGIGFGTVQSNFQAIAIKQAPSNRKALATSTYFIFLDLATGSGPYLLGTLIGFMSFRHLYITIAMWIIVCLGIYYIFHGKRVRTNNKSIMYHG